VATKKELMLLILGNYEMPKRRKRKSTVNKSGNYTKPALRKRIFNRILAANIQGTAAGKWSARKAQLLAKRYKKAGGGYR
tara:strand:- start:73 stop:312 length:240 start_codon:yes stop_codon:yes gene_type:complete